ncbi:MAG: phosphoesterase, partial [Finegoldia magna]|nr:phosphoesterase [Finegoldia magna]
GSIARMTNTESERKRIPKVLIIELTKDDIKIEEIFLKSAKNSREIFSNDKLNPYSIKNKSLLDIKERLSKLSSNPIIDINNNLKSIGREMKIDEEIIDEAIRRIE